MAKKYLIIILSLVLVTFMGLATGVFYVYGQKSQTWSHINTKPQPQVTPTPTPDPLAPKHILLLGHGGPNHDGGGLTDTIMLTQVDPRQKIVTLISIPRDLWVGLPINKNGQSHYSKINAAYAIGNDDLGYSQKPQKYQGENGGANLAKDVVTQITGVPIDYYVAVDFAGFENIINSLSGIEVYVPWAFDDPYYPLPDKKTDLCGKSEEEIVQIEATLSGELIEQQFSCRFETLHFDQGLQTMDGTQALKYARSRHSPQNGGDFSRNLRQQAVIKAFKDKVLNLYAITKIPQLISQLMQNVRTDFDLNSIKLALKLQPELDQYQIYTIALSDKNVLMFSNSPDGQSILMPRAGFDKWTGLQEYLKQEIASTSAQLNSSTN